jgi:FkbM family methyltransferase
MKNLSRLFKKRDKVDQDHYPSAIEILNEVSPWVMSETERAKMTVACRDTDYIPKVSDAGKVARLDGEKVQVMHNNLKLIYGGYFGEWMGRIIRDLKGHHEPQEEKVFYEVMKKLDGKGSMIELGAFWAYYSLWYKSKNPDALVVACEPDPLNIEVGIKNAMINGLQVEFVQSAAGEINDKKIAFKPDSSSYQGTVNTKIRTVDSLVESFKISRLDLLHLDVQGVELAALKGAKKTIESKKIRFIFVSTHHYSISNSVTTHSDCLEWLISHGAQIVMEHSVNESFSGDGLIVASFDRRDKDFKVKTSINSANNSLFRPYEKDLGLIVDRYDKLIDIIKKSK